jgi:hypothetical protein
MYIYLFYLKRLLNNGLTLNFILCTYHKTQNVVVLLEVVDDGKPGSESRALGIGLRPGEALCQEEAAGRPTIRLLVCARGTCACKSEKTRSMPWQRPDFNFERDPVGDHCPMGIKLSPRGEDPLFVPPFFRENVRPWGVEHFPWGSKFTPDVQVHT